MIDALTWNPFEAFFTEGAPIRFTLAAGERFDLNPAEAQAQLQQLCAAGHPRGTLARRFAGWIHYRTGVKLPWGQAENVMHALDKFAEMQEMMRQTAVHTRQTFPYPPPGQ